MGVPQLNIFHAAASGDRFCVEDHDVDIQSTGDVFNVFVELVQACPHRERFSTIRYH